MMDTVCQWATMENVLKVLTAHLINIAAWESALISRRLEIHASIEMNVVVQLPASIRMAILSPGNALNIFRLIIMLRKMSR